MRTQTEGLMEFGEGIFIIFNLNPTTLALNLMIQERKKRNHIFLLGILKGVVGCKLVETLRFCLCR